MKLTPRHLMSGAILFLAAGLCGAQAPTAPPQQPPTYGPPISLEQAKKVMAGAEGWTPCTSRRARSRARER